MNALEIIEDALYDLEHSKITCEEFDQIVEPFRDCVSVKKGKWKVTREFHGFSDDLACRKALACSVCKVAFPENYGYGIEDMLEDFRYCPHCGARMDGK